jgi:flagellar basal body-associated protein FliL
MAEEAAVAEVPEEVKKKSGGALKAIIFAVLGMVCGAGGFAVPLLFPGMFGGEKTKEAVVEAQEEGKVTIGFVEFGETTVNLNSDRLNRYLRIKITLQVKEEDKEHITQLVEDQKALLKSWLISYLSDVSMEDIRGAAGQNRLRREIQDQFNTLLFDDGYDRIRDLLFEEFNVQ